MAQFIDDTQEVCINDIDSDWLQVQIKNQIYTLSYDAAIDLALRLAMVTSKMDGNPRSSDQNYTN